MDDGLAVDDVFFDAPVSTSPHVGAYVGPHPPLPLSATVPPNLMSIEEGTGVDEAGLDVTG